MDSCIADIFDPGNTVGVSGSVGSPAYAGFILTEGGEGGTRITADLSAGNTFTSVFTVPFATSFAIAAFGTWVGILTVEYSIVGPTGPWITFETRTANFYEILSILATPRWGRIGFHTAEYTSGTAHAAILQPPGNRIAIMEGGVQVGALQLEGTS